MIEETIRGDCGCLRALDLRARKSTLTLSTPFSRLVANDQFIVRIAEKPEEIKELPEAGFEYACTKDKLIFLRKENDTKAKHLQQAETSKMWPG